MKLILSSLALVGLASAQCATEQPACQQAIKADPDTYGTVVPTCFSWKKPVKCITKNAPSEAAKQFALDCVDAAVEFKNCFSQIDAVEVAAEKPAADSAAVEDGPCPTAAPKCVANINKWKVYKKVRPCLEMDTEAAFNTCKNNKSKKLNDVQKTFLTNCFAENYHFKTCVEPLVCPACECEAASQEAGAVAAATTQPNKVDSAVTFAMAKCLIQSYSQAPPPDADMFDATVESMRQFCAMFA